MPNTNIPYQYNFGPNPVDTASPISGRRDNNGSERLDLKSTIQRQSSQIEVLTRELKRTQAKVRDLESQLQSVITTLRRDR